MKRIIVLFIILMIFALSFAVVHEVTAEQQSEQGVVQLPQINVQMDPNSNPKEFAIGIQILLILTVLSVAPAILIMMTSFTRIIVVLSFLRHGLGTQQMPPNQILIGLAMFLTFFIMAPIWQQINSEALQPYLANELSQKDAFHKSLIPIRGFLLNHTREHDLALMVHLSKMPQPKNPSDIPTHVLVPAFITSELKTAFQLSFLIYMPFLIIDLVIASTLMSMGMMMLPPVMISLPFKLLLFVLADGWHLIVTSLVTGFR